MARDRSASPFQTLTAILLWAALLLALWIALTDNTRRWDTWVGFGCALVAGAAAHLAARSGGVDLAVRGRWLRGAAAAPWWVVRDSAVVLAATLRTLATGRRPAGRMRPVRWSPGGQDPLDRGRRAIAYGVGSAGPNQYVVAGSEEDGVLLVHELEPASSVAAVDVVAEDGR